MKPSDIDYDAVRATKLMWISVTGLSEEPSRQSHFAVLEARARKQFTVVDLDYRPGSLWEVDRIVEGFRSEGLSRHQVGETLFEQFMNVRADQFELGIHA